MKCPQCNNSTGITIDMHSDGYADNLFECTSCDTIWIESFGEKTVLKKVA